MSHESSPTRDFGQLESLRQAYAIKKDPYQALDSLARKGIGNADFHFGKRRVIFVGEPETAKDLLTQPDTRISKYTMDMLVFRDLGGDNIFNVGGGEEWERRRSAEKPAFHQKMIDGYGPTVISETQEFIRNFQGKNDAVDMNLELSILTAKIAAQILFGYSTGGSEGLELQAAVRKSIQAYSSIIKGGAIAYELGISRDVKRVKDGKRRMEDFAEDVLQVRSERENLLQMMADAYPHDELIDEIVYYFGAAHETTASSLEWALIELEKHPEWKQKMRDEMKDWDGSWESLSNMPVSSAVFKEGMRIHPPIWTVNRSVDEEFEAAGIGKVTPGTFLSISPYYIHRNRKYWDNPEEFDPSRFLRNESIPSMTYLPFGIGKRSCIGGQLAIKEGPAILSLLVQAFDVKTHNKITPEIAAVLRPKEYLATMSPVI